MAIFKGATDGVPTDVPNSCHVNELNMEIEEIVLPDDTVLIAGAGPVGLLLATVLSRYGVKSVLLERNFTTTKWPKMDLTNARSMELFRRLGLADSLRSKGVPSHIAADVLISSGLSRPAPITAWRHPSVDQYHKLIAEHNDGTMPLEPWQRISQSIFEAWLKTECDNDPSVEAQFGWKVEQTEEAFDQVKTHVTEVKTGKKFVYISKYLVGCDGASSKVRMSLGIPLEGGPTPGYVLLIHFKSTDLARLHVQGRFWHIFFANAEFGLGGAIIAQDEVDTWTTHLFMPIDADHTKISAEDAVAKVLGGMGEPYPVKIDEVLVRSTYRPYIAIARDYRSVGGRIFLAGDACHQNIPTGGYGMNMGLGDAFDLGWKLAMSIHGFAGPLLLESYEAERRPVAIRLAERSGVHMTVHGAMAALLQPDPAAVDADSKDGRAMRQRIHEHYQKNNGENTDLGVEMGYRYNSKVIFADTETIEPEWAPAFYTPTTWPGGRAPHVFLNDGTPIFNVYGQYYTLIEFADEGDNNTISNDAVRLLTAAKAYEVPLRNVRLVGEDNARRIWERPLVLIRPDGHVSWRGHSIASPEMAIKIISVATGQEQGGIAIAERTGLLNKDISDIGVFSAVMDKHIHENLFEVLQMGEFQR